MAKIERYLGTLLTDFFLKRREFAEYSDSQGDIPSLVISIVKYPVRPYNPFSIRVSLVSTGFGEDFIVAKDNRSNMYYWFRDKDSDNYGYFPDWISALQDLELYLMEYLDTEKAWDTVVEF